VEPAQHDAQQLLSALEQEKKKNWEHGPTSMLRLASEERRIRLGYVPGPGEPSLKQRQELAAAKATAADVALTVGAYPQTFDLTQVGGQSFVSPVWDQGRCGSCVAFGTVATVEATIRLAGGDPHFAVDLSEAHLFYCLAAAQGRTCANGWWVPPALDAFRDQGVADEPCFPYTPGDQSCERCPDWQNRLTKITGWHDIDSPGSMKEWLAAKGALVAVFVVYEDFFAYRSGIYHNVVQTANPGGHCVSVVGYDDNQGYWKCKNSWGTGWGEGGFFRIQYGEVGIDERMWAVEVAQVSAWQKDTRIVALWANDAMRNAYAYVEGLGWKRLSPAGDSAFLAMLVQLTAAKSASRPVDLRLQGDVIVEIYVR
jgi:C1A family cysteine protease